MGLGILVVLLATSAAPPQKSPPRVGRILILGNEWTHQGWILSLVPLYPGQKLERRDVRLAQDNLRWWEIWGKATVVVEDDPFIPDSPFKNVIVTIEEGPWNPYIFEILDSNAWKIAFAYGCFAVYRAAGSLATLEHALDPVADLLDQAVECIAGR